MSLARPVLALRRLARAAAGLAASAGAAAWVLRGPPAPLEAAAVAALLAVVLVRAQRRQRLAPAFLPALEGGAALVVLGHVVARVVTDPALAPYPPLLAATLAGATTAGAAAPVAVALAAALAQALALAAAPGGPVPAPAAAAALVFGGLSVAFARVELARVRARSRRELDDDRRRALEDARLFRMLSATESGGAASPRDAERLLRSSVHEARNGLFHTLDLLHRALRLHGAALLLLDERGTSLRLAEAVADGDALAPGPFAAHEGVLGAVALRGETVRLARLRPEFRGLPHYGGPCPARVFLGLPVLERGTPRGALLVDRATDEPFTPREEELLARAAAQLLRVLDNERVFVQLERAKHEQAILHRASQALGAALDEDAVVRAAFDAAQEIAPHELRVLTLWDPGRRRHVVRRAEGLGAEALGALSFAEGPSLVSMVVRNRHFLPYRGDFDPRQQTLFTRRADPGALRSALVLPLVSRESSLGTLVVADRRPRAFGRGVRATLEALANQTAVALANAAAVQRLEALATTDGLTGCLNKRALLEALEQKLKAAARFRRPLSLLVTDIDHFKRVNDEHGHAAGDVVIKGLGHLLMHAKRDTDLVGRFGGEEFVVLCEQTDTEGAVLLAERVRRQLEAHAFPADAGALQVTCSIGVATFPAHGADAEALFEAADRALYRAKRAGRNRVEVSDPLALPARAG